jgi:hypothetical protein
MARRSPARVRESAPAPRLNRRIPKIPGLTPAGEAAIVRLERTRLLPGAARDALDSWTRFLRDPYHRLFDARYGCGVPECCPDPADLRQLLEVVTHALPPKDARTLRRRLARLDESW